MSRPARVFHATSPGCVALTALVLLLGFGRAPAQSVTQPVLPSFGGYLGISFSNLRSDFAVDSSGFIDQAECGKFEEGTGRGVIVGGSFNFTPIPGYRLGLQPELHLTQSSLTYPCIDPARTRLPDGSLVSATTNFRTDLMMRSVALRLVLVSTPFPFPLDISVGPVVSLSLGGEYETSEEISSPREAEFISGGQTRAISRGDLQTAAGPSLAIGGGVSYRARIGRTLELVPEIGYMIDLGRHDAPLDLSERALRLTLGVLHTPIPDPPTAFPPPPIPPPPQPIALRATLELDAIAPSGRLRDTLEYSLRRTVTTRLHPLLTYVFFDEGSDRLDTRYRRRTDEQIAGFVEARLESQSVLETYHNVLDIIGARLRDYPDATVSITGTQPDLKDPALKLARRRADTVAGYLADIWKIAPGRIRVVTRARPQTASNEGSEEGRQENRRVEITSDRYEVVAPVLLADTSVTSLVSGIRIAGSTPDSARIVSWQIDLVRDGAIVSSEQGTGAPPAEIRRPELRLAGGSESRLERLEGVFTIRDAAGNEGMARSQIAVRHRDELDAVDYGAGQYSLILFDFGRSVLRAEHQRIIDLINSRTPAGSKSTVAGFTDRLGEAALNLDLSRQRATTVARTLTGTIEKIVGEGEERLLYDNELPEGRFYSRCVTIEVRTE